MNLLQASYCQMQSDIHAGGPGSGRRPGGQTKVTRAPNGMAINKRTGDYSERNDRITEKQTQKAHIAKKISQGYTLVKKGQFPNGTLRHTMKDKNGRTKEYQILNNKATGLF
jgi:hypothetical protein